MKEFNMTDIDELTKRVNDLVAEIDSAVAKRHGDAWLATAKARHRVTVEHDDGDYGDGDSNPSLDASEADDDGDNPGNDYDDDEDEDNGDLDKASINYVLSTNDASNRPGSLSSSTHGPNRHKFEALVSHIRNDRGVPASEAMAIARREFPDTYRSFQQHTNNSGSTAKRAPSTFEDLVNAEMAKGCNREIAGQRVAQLHGFRAFDNGSRITKRRGDLLWEFQKRVDEIMYKDQVDATEATRRARQEDPRLFAAMQRAG
jgi:hypothetical protein